MTGSSISGNIFLDQNGDGSLEAADAGVSGVVVDLLKLNTATNTYSLVANTVSDASGNYAFSALPAGTYRVSVVAPSGDTFSPVGSSTSYTNTTVGTSGQSASPIVLGAATTVTNQDAGLYVPATFSGTVFADSNDDGLEDNADTGISGTTVQLLNASGAVVSTTTTGSNGTYTFSNLAPGTYSAHVVAPTGSTYSVTGSNATPQPTGGTVSPSAPNLITNGQFNSIGTSSFFSGWTESSNTSATPYGSGPGAGPELYVYSANAAAYGTPKNYQTDNYAGTPSVDNVSPYYSTASTSAAGTAAYFVDDGAIETLSQTISVTAGTTYEVGFDLDETLPGENNPGFFSLTASINGVPIVTAGSTSGTILTPGTWTHFADLYTASTTGSVTLTFTYKSGDPGSTLTSKDVLVDDVYVAAGQYTTNLTPTSEVNPTTGTTAPVTLASGQSVSDESAGIVYQPATITGTVFADSNADGIRESAEAGVSGVTVNLQNAVGLVIATTTTNATGTYTFTDQAAGTYTVQVVDPTGDTFSPSGSSTTLTDSIVSSAGTKTVTVANGATATVNAGLHGSASVSGVVFSDLNADGTDDGNDAGIAGQTVKLMNGTTVIATTTTNSLGAYSFTGVSPGSYTVQVTALSGETFSPAGTLPNSMVSASGAATVTVASGGTATVNAGEYQAGTVTGTVFTDLTGTGTSAGEPGLAGQTVQLMNGTTVIATTTTGSTGAYSFANVTPGSYTVEVVKAAGETFSPAGTLPNSMVSASGAATVTVASGGTATVNAGEYQAGTVTGTVFTDLTGTGTSAGEPGLAGQTVQLLNGTTVIATTTTGSTGAYSFANVTPGSYTVEVVKASGETFSPAGTLPNSMVSASGAATVTVASGGTATVNAGEYQAGTVTGTVFTDLTGTGTSAGEPGLAGQTVQLMNGTTVIATTTTGSTGAYSFANVTPGSYTVEVVKAAGETFSPAGTLPNSMVSASGAATVTVASGGTATVNAGEYQAGTVTGTVFTDLTGTGTSAGEPGLAGQTVQLLNGTTVIATTTTGSTGAYSFANVTPGSYTVEVVKASGETFSPAGTLPNSMVSASGAATVTVASGGTATVNAGEYQAGTVTGTVFTDENANGIQQAGDTGLASQTVQLMNGTTVIATTTTGSTGAYSFANVTPGSYTVEVVKAAGETFSPAGTLPNSMVSASGAATVTVASGGTATVNAGEYQAGTVTGTVFTDLTGTGTSVGEPGLAGQTVQLMNGTTVIATTTTGATGSYSFANVTPGSYTVEVVKASGETFSPAGTLPNSMVSASGAATVTVASGGTATVNAGEYQAGTVTGTVFTDLTGTGTSAGEPGLAGQTVQLLNGTTVIATTTTGSTGAYSFANVTPGSYTVEVVKASGETFSPAGTLPNSMVSASGAATVTVASGGTATVNAGEYQAGTVTGTVFTDLTGTGTSAGEPGLAGQTVQLLNGTTVIATTTTGATGSYSFANVTPGSYTVEVVKASGETFSPAGTLPNSMVSASGAATVTVASGGTATVNAGEYQAGTVTGTVFTDLTGTGTSAGEPGLAGQTVQLLNGTTVIATTTTGATGSYSFANVTPGSYTVEVVKASGETFSPAGTLPNSMVSASGAATVTVASGGTATVNAGEYQAGTVTGTVFTDLTGTGTSAGEPGLAGQTVQLLNGTTVIATTTTGSTGAYSFANVTPGSYTVEVVKAAGETFSPAGTLPNSMVSASGAATVTVASGGTATVNAGEYQAGTVTGTVFTDLTGTGTSAGEPGLAGQTVQLLNGTTVIATTTTGATGSYSFANVTPGSYTVEVVKAAGETFSPAGTLPNSMVSASGAATVTVASGGTATVNAGEYQAGTVTGTVFTDLTGTGTSVGEPGLAGQTVQLMNGTTVIATTTTGSTGAYSFANVTPGSYTVEVVKAAGETFSPAGTLPNSMVSANGAATVTVASGGTATVNAGEYQAGTVTGTVFTDENANGIQQAGEPGLAVQTVQLMNGTTVIATTTTGSTGAYSFANVTPGSYTVEVVKASGETFSPAGTLPNSMVSASGAATVTVASGGTATVNAGEYQAGTVTGTVFTDLTGTGTSAGEPGLAGQTVQLLNGTTVIATTTTGNTGAYSFANVTPGSYTVEVVKAAGETFSPAGTLPNSMVSASGAATVTVASGGTATVNAGEYQAVTVTGTVFNDANADGVQEAGDSGLAGQTVSLLNGTTVIATTTTGATGSYSFANVTPGSYTVEVVKIAGDTFSPTGQSTTLPNSGVSATGIATVTVASDGTNVVNAGEYQPGLGTISSMVFFDGQADGTYHVGDPGVEGVTVKLMSGTTVVATTMTGSTGAYSFTGVTPGTYTVQVVAPAGMSFSTAEHASGNPLLDSDVNATTGLTNAFTVTANATTAGTNAGLVLNGNFAGTTPTVIGSGQAYSGNLGSGVIVGSGNDNVHTGSGGNNVVILGSGANIIEEGSGATTDIGTSVGALNAQTQGAASGFLFAGTGNSVLQGEQGNTYLVGGTGQNTVAGGSANNLLVGGIGGGSVTANGTSVSSYTTGSEVRLTGTSDTVLYQKGDGVQVLDNTFNPATDKLEIYGYTGGRMETLPNGQEALYLGGNDLIVFNGGNPFTNGTGSSFSGISFNANVAAAPQSVMTFGANGLPEIVASGGATTAAPVAPQPSTISGTVFSDMNDNGTQNAGDSGLAGQTVQLLNGATVIATTTTGSTGAYSFAGVTPGNYTVHVAKPAGETFSVGGSIAVTTTSGSTITGVNTGEYAPASASAGSPTSISMSAYNQSLTLDNQSYTVSGSQGNATITAGNGADHISAGGYNNTITLGSGNNSVSGPQGNTTVLVGSGNNTIALQGFGNTITTGSGNNTIVAGSGDDTVNTQSGNDAVTLSGWTNFVSGGIGADTFIGGDGNTFQISGVGNAGGMTVKDFSFSNGDVLDLSKVLAQAGWNNAATTLGSFLKVSEIGNNTVVAVDPTGSASNFHTVATLDNLGASTLATLQSHNAITL